MVCVLYFGDSLTFREKILPPSTMQKRTPNISPPTQLAACSVGFLVNVLFSPENDGDRFLRNVRFSPYNTGLKDPEDH
jgi:hypothetical protein